MTSESSVPSASDRQAPDGGPGLDRLDDRVLSVIEVPGRAAKPRQRGQTVMADKGLGIREAEDLLELVGDFVDWVKIASSTVRLYRPGLLARKLAVYREADIKVLLTGDVVELGVVRGLADQIYAEAASLEFQAVEVASAQTIVSTATKAALVQRARRHGLEVFAEVGRKGNPGSRPHGRWLAREADELLEAGAYRVLVQGEGIVEDVADIDEDALLTFAAAVPGDLTVFQAKDDRARSWFLRNLGPDVNLDVDAPAVAQLELLRRGLKSRGFAGLVTTAP